MNYYKKNGKRENDKKQCLQILNKVYRIKKKTKNDFKNIKLYFSNIKETKTLKYLDFLKNKF